MQVYVETNVKLTSFRVCSFVACLCVELHLRALLRLSPSSTALVGFMLFALFRTLTIIGNAVSFKYFPYCRGRVSRVFLRWSYAKVLPSRCLAARVLQWSAQLSHYIELFVGLWTLAICAMFRGIPATSNVMKGWRMTSRNIILKSQAPQLVLLQLEPIKLEHGVWTTKDSPPSANSIDSHLFNHSKRFSSCPTYQCTACTSEFACSMLSSDRPGPKMRGALRETSSVQVGSRNWWACWITPHFILLVTGLPTLNGSPGRTRVGFLFCWFPAFPQLRFLRKSLSCLQIGRTTTLRGYGEVEPI